MPFLKPLILAQSLYTLTTAAWALVDIRSFMVVTGHKTDQWLVKTMSALLIVIGITLLSFLTAPDKRSALLLGTCTSVALLSVDFYYVFMNVISPVYLLDGLLEYIFLIAWLFTAGFRWHEIQGRQL